MLRSSKINRARIASPGRGWLSFAAKG